MSDDTWLRAATRPRAKYAPGPRRRRRRLLVSVVIAATALSAGVWTTSRRDPADSGALPGITGTDPGVVHVHGLGVDPADESLYAATHLGLFRLPTEGAATRVAGRYQDTMGFTVVGPRHFLGSGHPDLREELPGDAEPLLGLIESTDSGETWSRRSLLGQADFHGLQVVPTSSGQIIYGYDSTSQTFMVSDDGVEWDRRASIEAVAFAVDPVDPNTVIAASAEGVLRSNNGGRTFTSAAGPPLAAMSWDRSVGLWGASASGAVWRSRDGVAWAGTGGLPGEVEAILATQSAIYASVYRGAIYRSADDGATWQVRYQEPAS